MRNEENWMLFVKIAYHQRSKIESTMYRFKRIFGFSFQYRNKNSRKNEAIIKTNLLNQMFLLGKAEYAM